MIDNVKRMKIGAVISHRNDYGNDRLEIEVEVADDEDYRDVYQDAKTEVYKLLGQGDLLEATRKLEREYNDLCDKVCKASQQWEEMRAFLAAQGIRPDAPPFPQLPLLTEATSRPALTSGYQEDF